MKIVLQTKEIFKRYRPGEPNEVVALSNVSLEIRENSWNVITGESGSGKSTLLGLLAALDRPTSGRVEYRGEDISFSSDVRQTAYRKKTAGIVFQEYHLLERITALENVAMPLVVTGISRKEREVQALKLLTDVGLSDRALHLPGQLSGGERQRVALARALIHDPEILFADEPTSNLDRKNQQLILSLLNQLRRMGRTLVIVSHDPAVTACADRIFPLDRGVLQ